MSKNKIGEDSPIPKFIYLKIRRRDGVKSLTTLEEGELQVPIDGCINLLKSNCERVKTFFATFGLKYLVPTISVISVTDL